MNKVKNYIKTIGLDFPSTSMELELFNKQHLNFKINSDPEKIDPHVLLAKLKEEKGKTEKVSGSEYFKRTVLAAEIVYQLHNEYTLGHLKLQKLIYLCQNTQKMSLNVNFLKQAMGPYDPKLMRSLDRQLEKKSWFKYNYNGKKKYEPLSNAGGHKEWFVKYFTNQEEGISYLIETFRKFKSDDIELVATIYACWLAIGNTLEENNNSKLIEAVFNWHPSKAKKFNTKQVEDYISWMREKGIYPS